MRRAPLLGQRKTLFFVLPKLTGRETIAMGIHSYFGNSSRTLCLITGILSSSAACFYCRSVRLSRAAKTVAPVTTQHATGKNTPAEARQVEQLIECHSKGRVGEYAS